MKINHLSLCMIVKNSEKTIAQCLEEAIKYFEDIVIVDTGSNDRTIEIIKNYTNRIFDYKWNDDFSAARNYSISLASNDWVFVLDSDEIIKEFDAKNVEQFIKENNNIPVIGRIKRVNIFEDDTNCFYSKYVEWINRVFNRKYFHYVGIIHEQILIKNFQRNYIQTEKLGVVIEHQGYRKDLIFTSEKIERNIKLLTKALIEHPDDEYLLYQLGKSFFTKKDYQSAKENFERAIKLIKNYNFEFVEDLVISYGYTLLNLGEYKKAMNLENYKKNFEDSADFHFLLALIYMNNAMFEKAIEEFLTCLEFKESKIEGVNSFLAYYNIGVIYEVLGYKEIAKSYYLKCGDFKLAKNRLKEMQFRR